MTERDLKLKFSGDASGLAKATADAQNNIKGIKHVAEGLKSGFQAFAAGKGLANDLTDALNGNAEAIASVVGNLGNMASSIALAFRVHPIVGIITSVVAASTVIHGYFDANKKLSEAEIKKNKERAESVLKIAREYIKLKEAMDKTGKSTALQDRLEAIDAKAEETIKSMQKQLDSLQRTRETKIKAGIDTTELKALDDKIYNVQVEIQTTGFNAINDKISQLQKSIREKFDTIDFGNLRDNLYGRVSDSTLNTIEQSLRDYGNMVSDVVPNISSVAGTDALGIVNDKLNTTFETLKEIRSLTLDLNRLNRDYSKGINEFTSPDRNPPKETKDKPFSYIPDAPTDQLRRIGGIIGSVRPVDIMGEYERRSITEQVKIEQNTKQTVAAIKQLSLGTGKVLLT